MTAGSVDDGKSTLIGRLLYDSRSIFADQLAAIERHSRGRHAGGIDFSLLTDGLRSEREQGITIDVAHRYFFTAKRKFVIIDAPGHIQYTRNMVTGASNAQLIVLLIDARHGVAEQTRRHAAIAGLLKIPHVVVAVNKMDLVGYSVERFKSIVADFAGIAKRLQLQNVLNIPMSALHGDNIVGRSANMAWYEGLPLLALLEEIGIGDGAGEASGRLSVQYVIRPPSGTAERRRYAGRIGSGVFQKDDHVTVLPAGFESRIVGIEMGGRAVALAYAQQSVALRLEDEFDIGRGDLMVTGELPQIGQDLEMLVIWMDEKVLQPGNRYLLQIATRSVRCVVRSIEYLLDIRTLEKHPKPSGAGLNDIVRVSVRAASPVPYDRYNEARPNGCAILIDETSYATAGACILL
jgi:sulfate adenylyltransferase subunit 1